MKRIFRALLVLLLTCNFAFAQQLQTLDDTDSLKQRRVKTNANFQPLLDKINNDVGLKETALTVSGPLRQSSNAIDCPTCLAGEINVDTYASLSAAVAAMGSTPKTLTVSRAKAISSSLAIPNTIALRITGDGQLSVAPGVTLTINGSLDAPLKQIFTGTGTVRFGERIFQVHPIWFGAAQDGSRDDASAVQKAINALGSNSGHIHPGEVVITGPTAIGSTILIKRKSLKLRGTGWGVSDEAPRASYLKWVGSAGAPMVQFQSALGSGVEDLRLIGKSTAKPSAAINFNQAGGDNQTAYNYTRRVYIGSMDGYDSDFATQFDAGILIDGTANCDTNSIDFFRIQKCTVGIDIQNVQALETHISNGFIGGCGTGVKTTATITSINNLTMGLSTVADFDLAGNGASLLAQNYGSESSARMAKMVSGTRLHVIHGLFQTDANFTPADSGNNRWFIDGGATAGSYAVVLESFLLTNNGSTINPQLRLGASGSGNTVLVKTVNSNLQPGNVATFTLAANFGQTHIELDDTAGTTGRTMHADRFIGDYADSGDRDYQPFRFDIAGKTNIYGGPFRVKSLPALVGGSNVGVTPTGSGATTYSYRVSALTYDGETIPSTAVTCTNGMLGSAGRLNTILWYQVAGAYAYKIYGRTGGSELLMATVLPTDANQRNNGYQWVDDGSVKPSGTIPAANTTGNVIVDGSLKLGGGTAIKKVLSATASLDFAAWSGSDCQDLTLPLTGAADGDVVSLGVPKALASLAGVQFTAFVSAANTVKVRGCKITSGASSDPSAATVRATITQH